MKNSNSHPQSKQFSYLGSTAHYPKVLSFTIDYMWLIIRPDFGSRTLKDCFQKLRITACKQLDEIELDIAELDIYQITSSCADIPVAYFDVLQKNDKLIIKLGRTFYKNNTIDLDIRYSAGYYSKDGVRKIREPRSGFYFVTRTQSSSSKQAWTQGETLEAKYWFPCLEDPQVKFPREIKVIVSENDLIVLSNGELAQKDGNTWTWTEPNPTPSYLTSVVIGKFAQEHQQYAREYKHNGNKQNRSSGVPLSYYWPSEIPKKDAMLTFINTPKIMKFFEGYFGLKYPYKRYSQVAVEEFELGGMENTSCTTLTKYILHNEIAAIDYTRDIDVISHELAHQWFGDLVTCRDWADIWLNEGFATYCEALYWESVRGFDDFCYKVIKTADEYLEETRTRYERPLVTRIYKHPDDLFDAHSYEKGSCILHMLRSEIGDNDFRKMLYAYLDIYKNQSVETTNFLNIVEDISGKSLHRFFDQWIYGSGHPRLDIEFYLEHDMNKKKIRINISQIIQQGETPEWNGGGSKKNHGLGINQGSSDLFEFTLDLELVFSAEGIEKEHITEAVYISERKTEHWFEIPNSARIEWISIDPHFKLLKEIKSIKIINETNEFQIKEILKNQLRKGKTIIERIDAARALKKHYYEELLIELRAAVMNDPYYGVSVEAANTLGSYNEKSNYSKSDRTYNTLVACMCDDYEFSKLHPEIKQAIVRNIGHFRRKDSVDLLSPLLNKQSESYFVRAKAATAIGKSMNDGESSVDISGKENMIYQLKQIVDTTDSFRNVVACGAIDGLKEFFTDNNNYIVDDIANFLIRNTSCEKDYFKRLVATSALAKFLTSGKKNSDGKSTELREIHRKVFHHLLVLLRDKRRKVRINACKAFTDSDAKLTMPDPSLLEAVDALINVAKHDLDAYVKREAERCANKLREWINEWSNKPFNLDIMLREDTSSSCSNK